ncbi:hypothetical protein Tco_0664589 [Tanacetum coccineum]
MITADVGTQTVNYAEDERTWKSTRNNDKLPKKLAQKTGRSKKKDVMKERKIITSLALVQDTVSKSLILRTVAKKDVTSRYNQLL